MLNIIKPGTSENLIWTADGSLRELLPHPPVSRSADVAAIIVNRDRADLVEELMEQLAGMTTNLSVDAYVVEMGSDPANVSRHSSLHYEDPEFRGKCYGHNVALRLARANAQYRYYWVLMNDVRFADPASLDRLVSIAEAAPELAIISPTELDSGYPGSRPSEGQEFHLVSTCDYLGFLMRADAVEAAGFLNPQFKYSWGAIHELSYKLHQGGWRVAYCDRVIMKHLGGTTYGKTKNTVSREEYQRNAKAFCAKYFRTVYGRDWDRLFARALPPDVKINTFEIHRRLWEGDVAPRGPVKRALGAVRNLLVKS